MPIDPNVFLQEQANKPPCRHFEQYGYCEYGLLCKYSHITYDPSSGIFLYKYGFSSVSYRM